MSSSRKKKSSQAGPINARQESLQQQQQELQLREQKIKSFLAGAPKRAEELERRRREEGVARATGRSRSLNVPSGVNVRLNSFAATASAPRKLRRERKQQKIQFLVLILLLLGILYFLYTQLPK